jgi:hypothetical protein
MMAAMKTVGPLTNVADLGMILAVDVAVNADADTSMDVDVDVDNHHREQRYNAASYGMYTEQ